MNNLFLKLFVCFKQTIVLINISAKNNPRFTLNRAKLLSAKLSYRNCCIEVKETGLILDIQNQALFHDFNFQYNIYFSKYHSIFLNKTVNVANMILYQILHTWLNNSIAIFTELFNRFTQKRKLKGY